MAGSLGARQRPTDPRELAYRLSPQAGVDTTAPRSLARFLPAVYDQGPIGSCTAQVVAGAASVCAAIAGLPMPETPLSRLENYAKSRQKEGTFPNDAGAYLADAFSVALPGMGREALFPYVPDPTLTPPPEVVADDGAHVYISAHQPFYASDAGGMLAGLLTALDQQKPVGIALSWYSDFDNPNSAGVLPEAVVGQVRGGHAVLCWGYTPAHDGHAPLLACRQSWGRWTSSDVASIHPDAVPGDFFLPVTHLQNGVVWEARAATAASIPRPDPLDAFWGWVLPAIQYAATYHSEDELRVIIQTAIRFYPELAGVTA